MATFTLTGSGAQAIASPGSLAITITVFPSGLQAGNANPENWYHLGLLRLGNAHGYLPAVPLDATNMLLPCPNGATLLGYKLRAGVEITVEERAEQPYAGPTGPPGAAGAAGTSYSTLIQSIVLAADTAAIDFQSIPATFTHLYVVGKVRVTSASLNVPVRIRLNNDSGSNYDWWYTEGIAGITYAVTAANATTYMSMSRVPGSTAAASEGCNFEFMLADYVRTTYNKTIHGRHTTYTGTAAAGQIGMSFHGHWRNTAAVTRIALSDAGGGNMASGSRAELYGLQ